MNNIKKFKDLELISNVKKECEHIWAKSPDYVDPKTLMVVTDVCTKCHTAQGFDSTGAKHIISPADYRRIKIFYLKKDPNSKKPKINIPFINDYLIELANMEMKERIIEAIKFMIKTPILIFMFFKFVEITMRYITRFSK